MESNSSNLIQILTESMDKISQANDNYEINAIMEELLIEFTDSDTVNLFLYNTKNQELFSQKEDTTPLSMHDPEGLLGNAFLSKKSAVHNHPISDKYYVPEVDNSDKIKLKCQMIVPIVEKDELLGIIRVSRKIYHKKQYSKKDLELVHSLHTFIVKVIHILTNEKKIDYKTTIDTTAINEKIIASQTNTTTPINNTNALTLFANSVHDIRTPANTLYGFLELLEDQIHDIRLKEFVKNAKESAEFINTLTDNILEQAKESFSINTLKLTTVSSIKYFSQIANMFTANMFDKEISYLIYIDPCIPKEIKVDDHKLKRIITNLIGNAHKFTPKGKRIDFSVKFDKKMQALKISVTDNGIGIDTHRQEEIFNAFTQADEGIHENYGGSGLGLSISSQYVSALGGKLKLKSAIDVGSKFYFTIPIEVINASASYDKFKNLNKKITLLTKNIENVNIDNITKYLLKLGMPKEKIVVSSYLDSDTTHLFCFEDSFSESILNDVKAYNMKLLVVEKELFSLSSQLDTSVPVISENTFYGDMIHSTVYSERKRRVLIADDNKINITLLKYMLETDYVDITSVLDGESALNVLKKSQEENDPFDIVFLDKHMPIVSGTEVLKEIRTFEKEHQLEPVFAISITGDPEFNDTEKELYNMMVRKPFNKQKVQEAISQAL